MKKTIAKLNAHIDRLEAEFKQNDNRLNELKSNRASDEYRRLHNRQHAINDEIHNLLEQLWSLEK